MAENDKQASVWIEFPKREAVYMKWSYEND